MITNKYYLLRWRFEYLDRVKYGMWSNSGTRPEDQAWAQDKTGLVKAKIEAKDVATRQITTIAECSGDQYVNFQWIATATIQPFSINGSTTPITRIVGLRLITKDEKQEVYANGAMRTYPNTDQFTIHTGD